MPDTSTAPTDGKPKRLVLIDGSGYIFRAYHGLPPLTRKSDGLPVGAISGFCNMLYKLIKENRGDEAPSHLAVIFDAGSHTFRNDMYDQYKAHRPPPPEDLIPQFPLIRDATRAFGLPAIELPGYEADDLICTYAHIAKGQGFKVTIVSSDKDLMQLVDDDVTMLDPVKSTVVGREEVIEKFGVPPELVVDAQALIGDSADNVPGAPGIGVKTAAQLLIEYGNLDGILERAHEIKQEKRRQTLIDFKDQILLSRELVRLRCDTPDPHPLDDFILKQPEPETLTAFLVAMEFATLAKRVGGTLSALESSTAISQIPTAPILRPLYGVKHTAEDAAKQPFDLDAYECVQTIEALETWVARAIHAQVLAVDTETDDLSASHSNLVGVSLATAPNCACYIPLGHAPEGLDFGDELKQIPLDDALRVLKPLLEDRNILKVGQNIKYDLSVLHRYGIKVAPIDDTMLISYVLEGGLHGHGMDELSEMHLGHKPITFKDVAGSGKKAKSFKHVDLKEATRYAAEDADVTLRLWNLLKPRLQRERMTTVYETLERNMPAVLSEMELNGIRIDPDILRNLSQDFGSRMNAIEQEAHALLGRPFNIGSPQQLGQIFFDEMKLSGGKKTASGQWATDVKVLEDLAEQGVPLAKLVLDYRQMSKLKGTYTDNLVEYADPETRRIHTSFHLAATPTGRLSSNEPNLQNIPIRTAEGRKIRAAFVAKPGHKLISADYSQIELRILAHIGDIPQLKEAFTRGDDIHAMTASEMFNVPMAEMTSEIRRRAKAINFGIIYGISAFGLSNQLGIERGEAGRYIETYFDRFPGIKAYMDGARDYVRANGFVMTLFGRKIHIPEINGKGALRSFAERAAINAPIQGTAADIIRRAMMRMPDALTKAGFTTKMLLQVHDELIFEAPDAEVEAVMPLIKDVMSQASVPAVDFSVPLVVEANAAMNWDEAH
ncbi:MULTISPECIES: DNA polymerase I [Asticcacaulis]|uniref:DNA polymerase I n=1 Tax=Asticcacaulis TaxID=76890 RepID=UPI001AE68EA0|nr:MULTISPECIES: DNA polymerase I [Asticcacaulis]MBP2159386.1 DNA polymerase-1 [Asticcacaulis solisilvae]MDR6800431.1 DNA polymerase-1 [Asticcacaulis sp. BE141]